MALTKVKGSGLATGAATESLVGIDDNATSTAITIDASENVGINETAVNTTNSTKLEVKSSAASVTSAIRTTNKDETPGTAQGASLDFGLSRNTGTYKPQAGKITVGRDANWTSANANIDAYMSFSSYTANTLTEKMRITSAGKVGIGTTAPTYPLDIRGSGPRVHCQENGSTAYASIEGGGSSSYLRFGTGHLAVTGNGSERMRITSSGATDIKCYNGTSSSPTESRDWPTPALALRAYGNFTKESMLSFGYPNDAIYQAGNNVWNFRLDGAASATSSSSSTDLELKGPGTLILGSGAVTMPNQPAFLASTSGHTKAAGWQDISVGMTSENYDIGNNYSGGNFTAPIAGRYLFFWGGYSTYSTTGSVRYAFAATINGSQQYISGGQFSTGDTPLDSGSIVYNLSANDVVKLRMYSPSSISLGSGGHEAYFGGYLMG